MNKTLPPSHTCTTGHQLSKSGTLSAARIKGIMWTRKQKMEWKNSSRISVRNMSVPSLYFWKHFTWALRTNHFDLLISRTLIVGLVFKKQLSSLNSSLAVWSHLKDSHHTPIIELYIMGNGDKQRCCPTDPVPPPGQLAITLSLRSCTNIAFETYLESEKAEKPQQTSGTPGWLYSYKTWIRDQIKWTWRF